MAEVVRPLTEQELLEQVNTGRNAEELMAEPLMARWFHDVDETVVACIREASRMGNDEEFAHWSRMLQAIELHQKALVHYMQTGQVAARTLREPSLVKRQISRFKWAPAKRDSAA